MIQLLFKSPFGDKFISAFSWMLVHSLWQGLLLSIICGGLFTLNKQATAAFKCNLVTGLFFMFITTCGFTFTYEWSNTTTQGIATSIISTFDRSVHFGHVNSSGQFIRTIITYFSVNAPFIVLCWFVIFTYKSVRIMGAAVYNHRIKSRHVYQLAPYWNEMITHLCERLKIHKSVTLLGSGFIKIPVVIGHLKPVIVVPMGLLAGMPPAQVEAILLHELAHIQRSDYLINFLQNAAEAMFFFNPGLLWISSKLREERENCCDDIALAQTNDRRSFIQALISFEEQELGESACAASFAGEKNHLLQRVSRIVNKRNKNLGVGEKVFFISSTLAIAVLVTIMSMATVNRDEKAAVKKSDNNVIKQIKTTLLSAKKMKNGIINIKGANGIIYTKWVWKNHPNALKMQPESDTTQKEATNNLIVSKAVNKNVPGAKNDSNRLVAQPNMGGWWTGVKDRQIEIIKALLEENVITDINKLRFSLTKYELVVNGIKMGEDVHRKIINRYIKEPGDLLNISFDKRIIELSYNDPINRTD